MSKTKYKAATYSIKKLLDKVDSGSYKTRYDTQIMLNRIVQELHDSGYKISNIHGLKPKHIDVLLDRWKAQGKSPATIKNYMSKLRMTCELIGKGNIMKKDNASYGIPDRNYSTRDKALKDINLENINDENVKFSLALQKLFGLRREESIKFNVKYADRGDHIQLKGSWTKGNVPRIIPVTSGEQKYLISVLHKFAGDRSLIPKNKTYAEQLNRYSLEVLNAGIKNPHGLRHYYAQMRYQEIISELLHNKGWPCPHQGGKKYASMTKAEKEIDRKARVILSNNLGHSRIQIVKTYIG